MIILPNVELAWAAGFFDGEGCVQQNTTSNLKKTGNPKTYKNLKLSVGQSGADVPPALVRFQTAMGGRGIIRGPYGPYKDHQKQPVWQYNVTGTGAHEAFALLRPYLLTPGPKVARYDELLAEGGRA